MPSKRSPDEVTSEQAKIYEYSITGTPSEFNKVYDYAEMEPLQQIAGSKPVNFAVQIFFDPRDDALISIVGSVDGEHWTPIKDRRGVVLENITQNSLLEVTTSARYITVQCTEGDVNTDVDVVFCYREG